MSKPIYLKPAAELLGRILAGSLPADKQMESYFRAHREMGVRDRGAVAEMVYACLRRRRVLEHIAGGEQSESQNIVAAYLLIQGLSARALEAGGYRGDSAALAVRVRTLDADSLAFNVQTNLPDWLAERLRAQFGDAETRLLAEALARPAPVDLRVNTLKADRAQVQAHLGKEGFPSEPTPYSAVGLRRQERTPLFNTGSFKAGWYEIQDEGSQLLTLLLEPKRQEMVVDFCAGAGGKTLHIGALMANTGTVYAFDVSAKRLEKLKPRLKRSGLQNVRAVAIAHENDERVRRLAGKFDRVLVDAPCSGTGTLRRNPDIKWRDIDLTALAADQKNILAAAATLVKPGGRLVYATCSLLREENDEVVSDFLARHADFKPIPAGEILARRRVPLEMEGKALRLLPHRHGTDGFYAQAMTRN